MHLIFFIDNEKIMGGGDYAQFKFAEHLAALGHRVTIFAANRDRSISHIKNSSKLDIRYRNELRHYFKGIGVLNRIWERIYTNLVVLPYLRKNQPAIDYLVGYLRKSAIKAAALGKKFNIKTANFVFETPQWMQRKLGKRFLNEYKGDFKASWDEAKEAYLSSDVLLPNSKLTQKECSRWLKRKIENPIYPGVDASSIGKVKEKKQIIYVGRLNAYKNIDLIIKALSKMKNRPVLIIVGSGEELNNLKKLANRLGVDCEFKGNLTDSEKFLEIKRSMFMVFPSSFEGFGMPPAEALSCEKPCICSDIPVLREIYGENVEYFRENDIESLKSKLESLINDKPYRERKGKLGKKYVQKKYTWKNAALAIEKSLSEHTAK